jgi:hypothetical protein
MWYDGLRIEGIAAESYDIQSAARDYVLTSCKFGETKHIRFSLVIFASPQNHFCAGRHFLWRKQYQVDHIIFRGSNQLMVMVYMIFWNQEDSETPHNVVCLRGFLRTKTKKTCRHWSTFQAQ